MPGRPALRRLGALVVAAHLVLLVVAALPASRFKEAAGAPALGYVRATGQLQDWAMYQSPDRVRAEYDLLASYADGHEARPWGPSATMDSRRLYLLEGVLLAADGRALGERLLDVIHERTSDQPAPTRLRLRRTTVRLREFRDVPAAGVLAPLRGKDEIVRSF